MKKEDDHEEYGSQECPDCQREQERRVAESKRSGKRKRSLKALVRQELAEDEEDEGEEE